MNRFVGAMAILGALMAVVLPQEALAQDTSVLKICKEAGEGVEVGTLFTFNVNGQTVTVPAGPVPGGYCAVAGEFRLDSDVTILESDPDGYTVTVISMEPPGAIVGVPDLSGKQVTVKLGSGVTEVTFRNERHTGWLEICKEGKVKGDFTFTISPSLGSAGPFTVPAGACTPAIEVPAGTVTITEVAVSGVTMLSCRTIPADRQVECDPDALTSTVNIIPGDISQQTIAFIENRGEIETPEHDVAIEKTSMGSPAQNNNWVIGESGIFILNITNIGDPIEAGETVSISDFLPPGFTIDSDPSNDFWKCNWPAIPLVCEYIGLDVPAGTTSMGGIIIYATPGIPGVFENCAQVTLDGATDIDLSNNESCVTDVVEGQLPSGHDVAIEKTSTGGAVGFGGWFPGVPGTFTLQVTNLGPALNPPGTIIVTDDDFPPWFNIISAGGNGWNCSWPNNELTCTYIGGPVGPGPNQPLPPIVVTAEPGATGEFVNCAEVALNGATDIFLPNNESCIPVMVGIPSGSGYDVAIDKVSDGSNWPAGGTAYFVLRPTNIGTTITPPGTTVVVTDPVPAGFTISSVSGGPYWNCLFSTGTPANLSCTYSGPPVGPGQPFPPIQLFVNVPERPGEYRNCAGVELTGAMDTDLSNNNSCTVVTVDVGKSFEAARGGVVIVGVFTELTGTTVVNTGLIGEVGPVVVTGVDGETVDPDDVDIREENGSVTINVNIETLVGTIIIEGQDGTIVLEADGTRPSGPPGMTWPKDGAVNIQNGTLNETFAVPVAITRGEHPAGDYDIKIGDSPVDVIAIRGGEIAVTGRGIQMQESGETGISIAVKDGPRVSGQIPAWSYQLSAQAVTRLNTWAPIFFQCLGLPAREPIAIRFTPEPWQKIEPREVSLTCGEASSRIQIGQYQTSREGPQNLPAVIDRSPGR